MTQLNKIAVGKVQSLIALLDYNDPQKGYKILTRKLSSFYNSRSTRYASCLNDYPFLICDKKEAIIEAGFAPTCKAVITLANDEMVRNIAANMLEERLREIESEQKRDTEKKLKEQAILNEANELVIDEEFKIAVKWASEVEGEEKSKRSASAMKGLLERLGRELIETDFWQVYRILKTKASHI